MKRKDHFEWWRYFAQHFSGFNHQFIDPLTSKPCFKLLPHRKCVGIFEVAYLPAGGSYWSLFVSSPLGFGGLHDDINIFILLWGNHTRSYERNSNSKLNMYLLHVQYKIIEAYYPNRAVKAVRVMKVYM